MSNNDVRLMAIGDIEGPNSIALSVIAFTLIVGLVAVAICFCCAFGNKRGKRGLRGHSGKSVIGRPGNTGSQGDIGPQGNSGTNGGIGPQGPQGPTGGPAPDTVEAAVVTSSSSNPTTSVVYHTYSPILYSSGGMTVTGSPYFTIGGGNSSVIYSGPEGTMSIGVRGSTASVGVVSDQVYSIEVLKNGVTSLGQFEVLTPGPSFNFDSTLIVEPSDVFSLALANISTIGAAPPNAVLAGILAMDFKVRY